MKIVYITPDYWPHIGGIEKYVQSLAEYFRDKGLEITVITAERAIDDIIAETKDKIKILRVPVKSISGILIVKKQNYIEVIDKEISDADIVHLNDCKFLYKHLAKKKHCKLFLSSHGFIFHTENHRFLKELFFKKIVVKYQNYYDRIICVSEQDSHIAIKYGLKNLETVLPGVDIHKFECPKKKQTNIPRKFFYWGRIARNKGIAECLKKLGDLTDFVFILAGTCEDEFYMQELNQIIHEKCLENRVHFLGNKNDDEIKELINETDYILIPSLHEGFGMTLAESLLSNRKIIANTNTSFIKILTDSKATDYLFNFESSETNLENKIQDLESKHISPKNVEQFSLETMFNKISSIYFK